MDADNFVKQFFPVAKLIESETGIPALAMLAQSALETAWGTKVKGNNYFGIKGKDVLVRTTEILDKPDVHFPEVFSITKFKDENGKTKYKYDCKTWFAGYQTPIDAFRGYANFIKSNPRYKIALQQTTPETYLEAIAAAGYATGLNYKQSLLDVLKSVQKRVQ